MSLDDFKSTPGNSDTMWPDKCEFDSSYMWWFFLAFIAGEGSFSITISHRGGDGETSVSPIFSVKLDVSDKELLQMFYSYTGLGHINEGKSQGRHYVEWRTSNLEECKYIAEQIEAHAESTPFIYTSKYDSFLVWVDCLKLINGGEHMCDSGIAKLARMRDNMNNDGRGRSAKDVIQRHTDL